MDRPLDTLEWPGVLDDIARVAGPLAAYRVAQARGGVPSYFPRPGRLREDHWLVVACGWEAARRIAQAVGGAQIDVPLGPFAGNLAAGRRAIRALLAAGCSGREVAQRVGVTIRTVRNVKRRAGDVPTPDQYSLF